MNIIEKKRMLEGLLYNFSLSRDITDKQVDALISIRDTARSAGLILSPDQYGRIVAHTNSGGRQQIAIGLFI